MAEDLGGAVIGSLKVLIGADVAGLLEGVAASKDALGEFRAEEEITLGVTAALAAAVAAAAITFGVEFVKGSIEAINTQYELAQQLGTTTESVQVLDRAAQMSGSNADQVAASMRRLNATLGEVQQQGAGRAYEALQKLGLSARDLAAMNIDDRVHAIASRMDELGYSSSQEAAFLKDMGIRGGDLIAIFQNGGEVIGEAKKQVDGFGLAVSDIDAAKVHEANEAFETIGVALRGIGNEIAVDVAPYLADIGRMFEDNSEKGNHFKDTIQGVIDSIVLGIGNIGDAIQIIQVGVDSIEIIVMEVGETIGAFILGVLRDVNLLVQALTGLGQLAGNIPGLAGISEGAKGLQANMDGAINTMQAKVDAGAQDIEAKGQEIANFFTKPWPSENAQKWLDDVKKGTDDAGKAADDASKKLDHLLGNDGADTGPTDAEKKAAEARQKKLDSELASLQSSLGATEQSENESYNKQLDELNTFLQKKMVTQTQYDDLFTRLEQDHTDKLQQIRQKAFEEETRTQFATINMITNTLDAIGQAIQSSGEDHFGIAKAFSVATALLKGYESITSSYAAGAAIGGPILGAVFAGLAATATAAQIASLMAVTSSSSGTPTVAGGSSAAAAAAPAAAAPVGQTLTINGLGANDIFSGSMVRGLVEQLVQFQKDGGTLVVVR